jgi:hypothetical protein
MFNIAFLIYSVADMDLDPDLIRSLNPDPDLVSGSGSRRVKMTSKIMFLNKFHVLKC